MNKKILALGLSSAILFGNINTIQSYATSSNKCKKTLKLSTTYKYDLDGDGDKDTIKVYKSNNQLLLKVNNTKKVLEKAIKEVEIDGDHRITSYNYDKDMDSISIYDLNKNDKSLEIVYSHYGRILKFKNSTCKLDKKYGHMFRSYNANNGLVTFNGGCTEAFIDNIDSNVHKSLDKATSKVPLDMKYNIKINGYTATLQPTLTFNPYWSMKYKLAYKTNAYTNTKGTTKSFTLAKGDKVSVLGAYINGNRQYIKVKNSKNKVGYIKFTDKTLFTNYYNKCNYGTLHHDGSCYCMCEKLPKALRGKEYEITNAKKVDNGYGDIDIVGYLRNNSNKTWDYVEVMVTWYDKKGNVVSTTYDNLLNLKPNQRWKFVINTYGQCNKFKISKVTINNY